MPSLRRLRFKQQAVLLAALLAAGLVGGAVALPNFDAGFAQAAVASLGRRAQVQSSLYGNLLAKGKGHAVGRAGGLPGGDAAPEPEQPLERFSSVKPTTRTFSRPEEPALPPVGPLAFAVPIEPVPTPGAPSVVFPGGSPGGGGGVLSPGLPLPGGGGGGGGGGGVIPTPVPLVPPPTTSGVPEPTTWLLLLLGFGALGFRLRHHRRDRSSASFLTV